jgi:hypothetical protein
MKNLFNKKKFGFITKHSEIVDIISIFTIAALMFIAFYFTMEKPNSPEAAGKSYINLLNQKEYAKTIDYFINVPEDLMTQNEDINKALIYKYDGASNIKFKECKAKVKNKEYVLLFEVSKSGKLIEDQVTLVNVGDRKREWKVDFPLNTYHVLIKSMDGSKVIVDNKEIGTIKDGEFNISKIIEGAHDFKTNLSDIAESNLIKREIENNNEYIELQVKPLNQFKDSMVNILLNFAESWSKYCLTADRNNIKPYVTDRLYNEFAKDTGMFSGSKYVKAKGKIEYKDINIKGDTSVYITVAEVWDLKEVTTSSDIVFGDNNKNELDQTQFITCKYHLVKNEDSWKIDSLEQESFKKKINNP